MMLAGLIDEAKAFWVKLGGVNFKERQAQLEIDGLVYTSRKFAASTGLELWPRVTALLGSALTRTIVTGEGVDELDESQMMRIAQMALVGVADRAMKDGLIPLVKDLLQRTDCNQLYSTKKGGAVINDFDEHFAGEYGHLLKVCSFVLAHNLKGPTYGAR